MNEEEKKDVNTEGRKETTTPGNTQSKGKKKHRGKQNQKDDSSGKPSGSSSMRFTKMESRNPALLNAVAAIPFSYVAGLPFNTVSSADQVDWKHLKTIANTKYKDMVTPGFCVNYVAPGLPTTQNASSAVNAAFIQEFTFLRHTISASLPYEAGDVGMMYLAGSEIYSYINWLVRVYATSFSSPTDNRYYPIDVIAAQNVNPHDVMRNQAKFRANINLLADRASAICIPNKIPYIVERTTMFTDYYVEGTSALDQMYMYSPTGFWMYDETGDDGKPMLRYRKLTKSDPDSKIDLFTVDELFDYGMEMINGLLNSDVVGLISANVRRAYGDSNLAILAAVPEFLTIIPTMNIGVVEQMANATVLGSESGFGLLPGWDLNVRQIIPNESNPFFCLQFDPKYKLYNNSMSYDNGKGDITKRNPTSYHFRFYTNIQHQVMAAKILTTTTSETSPGLIVESSKYMLAMTMGGTEDDEKGTYRYVHLNCRCGIVVDSVLFTRGPLAVTTNVWPTGQTNPKLYFVPLQSVKTWVSYWTQMNVDGQLVRRWDFNQSSDIVNEFMDWDGLRDSFTFAPQQVMYHIGVRPEIDDQSMTWNDNYYAEVLNVQYAKDFGNYTIISIPELIKIHEVATIELFAIPGVAAAY